MTSMSKVDLRNKLLQCLGGPWPEPCDLRPRVTEVAQKDGYRIESLTYEAEPGDRIPALLKLQVGLHSLGRFEDSLEAASILGLVGGAPSAVLEARSAARMGDRKRTAAALERLAAEVERHYAALEELERRLTVLEERMIAAARTRLAGVRSAAGHR